MRTLEEQRKYNREKARRYRAKMTPERKAEVRKKQAQRLRERRAAYTPEQARQERVRSAETLLLHAGYTVIRPDGEAVTE